MTIPKFRIPDRFESIERLEVNDKLASFIVKVDQGLRVIQEFWDEMESTGRGSLLVLRGDPGIGKSTLLGTVHLFLDGVGRKVFGIGPDESIPDALDNLPAYALGERLRIVIIKGREALGNTSAADLETAIHSINQFIRTAEGEHTLVAWPCNTDDMQQKIVSLARQVGGTALLGEHNDAVLYAGPPKSSYLPIAKNMIEALNADMTLFNLGFTEAGAEQLAQDSTNIGAFLLKLARKAKQNRDALINRLPEKDWYQLWIVVVAGNDVENEVQVLTHGAGDSLDIDRLLQMTDDNVAKGLRAYAEKLGMLSTGMDAKLIHLPAGTAMAVLLDYADPSDARDKHFADTVKLPSEFKGDGETRLKASALARALRREPVTTQTPGPKPQPRKEFEALTAFAKDNDSALNRIVGRSLQACGLITSFADEQPTGDEQHQRRSDLLCTTEGGPVRIEFMWRKETNRASIAEYALGKLAGYGRAIGYLNGSVA
jgi:DNA (cytosine-5)-methyltransferase 1